MSMTYTTVYDEKQRRTIIVDAMGREKPEWHGDLDKGTPQPFRDHPRILYRNGETTRVETAAEEAAAAAQGWGRAVDHGMAVEASEPVKRGPGRPRRDAA